MQYTATALTLAGQRAAYARWAQTPDRVEAMAPARRGFMARFDRQVDPNGTLDPATRARLAEAAMRSHMAGLRLKQVMASDAKRHGKSTELQTVCSWCHPRIAGKTHQFCERHAAQFAREVGQVRARHAGSVA